MDFQVTLQRDSLNTPWGFRLEGGKDFHAPLTIQRVIAVFYLVGQGIYFIMKKMFKRFSRVLQLQVI